MRSDCYRIKKLLANAENNPNPIAIGSKNIPLPSLINIPLPPSKGE
jgi:hypothetical protein